MKGNLHTVPPRWPLRFLKLIIKSEYLEEIEGDMEEVFQDSLKMYSSSKAKRLYVKNAFQLMRLNLLKNFEWIFKINVIAMSLNNFKIASRTLFKSKTHSVINLIGLAMGLTIGGLIILYVSDELSFDNFHKKGERIFKITTNNDEDGIMETNAWPVAYKLKTEYPEIESVLYTRKASQSLKVNFEGKKFDHNIHYASEDFFNIFSFELKEGNPATSLDAPFSAVISESMSQNYFDGNAIGKTLTLRDTLEFQITGVVREIPANSHIQFDMLLSFSTFGKLSWFSYTEGWGNFNMRNYVLLKEGTDATGIIEKAKNLYTENAGEWMAEMGVTFYTHFIPLNEVYLKSGAYNGFGPSGSESQVRTVALVAIFVLLLACINYINLSTARSLNRAKEVGIKKVNGSSRLSLISQFLLESYLLTFIAFIFALFLMYALLPFFNQLIGRDYQISYFLNSIFLIRIFLLVSIIAFLAGFYPAWIISGFNTLDAIKGKISKNPKGLGLRKSLIIFQFFISAALVLSTFVVLSQLDYMRTQDLGFDKEQVVVLDAINISDRSSYQTLKNELQRLPNVESISFANALPGRPGWQGQWAYPDEKSDDPVDTEYMAIDEGYLSTLGLELIAGSNFDLNKPSELESGLVVNESLVHEMGWTSPQAAIGHEVVSPSSYPSGTIIGVVKDYHGLGLQEEIWPKAMDFNSARFGRYFAIKFSSENTYDLMKELEETWRSTFSDAPFEFFFLDDDFDRQYKEEERLANVLSLFAIVILIISGIGLFGLISFVALSRTKEVGIRKTLGATVSSIVFIFSKEFITLVIFGNLVAIPLVWYFGNRWLEDFAYHTEVQFMIFPLTIFITVLISFLTVSIQTMKTAKMNPVKALRYE